MAFVWRFLYGVCMALRFLAVNKSEILNKNHETIKRQSDNFVLTEW